MDWPLIILLVAAFVASFSATGIMAAVARGRGWVALPREDRWHRQATALHGGVGFFVPFFLGGLWIIASTSAGTLPLWRAVRGTPDPIGLTAAVLLGSLIMFLVGLWDDVKPLRPATKLVFQILAVTLFVSVGGVSRATAFAPLDVLITYFWFVGIINAFNMSDNMDGLASGLAIVGAAAGVIAILQMPGPKSDTELAMMLGLLFMVSVLGFFLHNRPPASIFMGDSGALSMGYILAALVWPTPLNGYLGVGPEGPHGYPSLAVLIAAAILAVPILDTTFVSITRTWRGQKAHQGGRDHLSHRLVKQGLSEQKAVWFLYFLAVMGGAVAMLTLRLPAQSLPILGLFGLLLTMIGVYLGREDGTVADSVPDHPAWAPWVSDFVYRRHTAEVLIDTVLAVIAFWGAYLLRFDGVIVDPMKTAMISALPVVVGCTLLAFFLTGVYGHQWQLVSLADVPRYAFGVLCGTSLSLAAVAMVSRFGLGHSRSAFIIFGVLLFLLVLGSRLSFRFFDLYLVRERSAKAAAHLKPILIYGAGKAGKLLYEEVLSNPHLSEYVIVGFIDDDHHRIDKRLYRIPIRSRKDWLRHPWRDPPEIWISSRSIQDDVALDFAAKLPGNVMVCRFTVNLEQIGKAD